MSQQLPAEILGKIALYTGDRLVAWVLRNHMPEIIYRAILLTKRKVLIYGQVQSGKTAAIMDVIRNPLYQDIRKIVIVQNSLLVLNQYRDRFTAAQIDFQIVSQKTGVVKSNVVIIMNNPIRYKLYRDSIKDPLQKYVLIMDEADAYGQHPLAEQALHEYYVTATPHHSIYKLPEFFHRIHKIDPPKFYQGLYNISIEHNDAPIDQIVASFQQDIPVGMMLINCFKYVHEMQQIAGLLSKMFPTICFVTLNNKRKLFLGGKIHKLCRNKTIANIIDLLKEAPHIVFIANRMSLRGLSYTSGNYSRHLTHQYSDLHKKTVTNALQRMRIFGIYKDQRPVKLILPVDNEPILAKMFAALDIDFAINRSFGTTDIAI